MRKLFSSLIKIHFEGKSPEDKPDNSKKGHHRESRSPSACKTPELTSESSSEEDSDDDGRFVWCVCTYVLACCMCVCAHTPMYMCD